ncbi:porin [Limnohabitans sp. T6-5]|uniref:porin n=1 Tax=Limnohabitans sp. T6-5 TaxID=1100724 RepID=UPI001304A1BD|nr:porin [Limnohabitans sp. T6-5]
MKNTQLFALSALAFISSAAFAETGVNIYGRGNVSLERQTVGSATENVFVDNSSRIGVRATRDIAGGMTTGVTLEAGTNLTTGSTNSTFFAREATVSLGGSFGQVKLGRLAGSAAYFATADYVSNHNHDTGTSSDALWDAASAFQFDRAVAYTSPKFNNMVVEAQYGLKKGADGNGITSTKVSPLSMAANYSMDALQLGLGYERGANGDTTDTLNAVTARAYYTMGPLGFGGYVQKTSGTGVDRTAFRLSAMYTMGQNEFHVNFGHAGNRGSEAKSGADQFTLGYNFILDKQTKVYALYTKLDNQANAAYDLARTFASTNAGQSASSYGVGIRYNF